MFYKQNCLCPLDLWTASLPLTGECLSNSAIELLVSLIQHYDVKPSILHHEQTLTASETQAVLLPGVFVQKTVSAYFSGQILLWTGVSDFRIQKGHLRMVARQLDLPNKVIKHHVINPPDLDSREQFGMAPGMVSPFLSPSCKHNVAAVVYLPHPAGIMRDAQVAISLSLYESLLLPLTYLRPILHEYARLSYPYIPIFDLESASEGEKELLTT